MQEGCNSLPLTQPRIYKQAGTHRRCVHAADTRRGRIPGSVPASTPRNRPPADERSGNTAGEAAPHRSRGRRPPWGRALRLPAPRRGQSGDGSGVRPRRRVPSRRGGRRGSPGTRTHAHTPPARPAPAAEAEPGFPRPRCSPLLGVQLPLQPPLADESHGAAQPSCRRRRRCRPGRAAARGGGESGPARGRRQAGSRSGGPGRGRPPRLYHRRGGGRWHKPPGKRSLRAPRVLRPRPGCGGAAGLQGRRGEGALRSAGAAGLPRRGGPQRGGAAAHPRSLRRPGRSCCRRLSRTDAGTEVPRGPGLTAAGAACGNTAPAGPGSLMAGPKIVFVGRRREGLALLQRERVCLMAVK